MYSLSQTRNERRKGWTSPTRIEALEQDLDETDTHFVKISNKIDKLTARATGLLVALTASAIMLSLNLVFGR